MGGDPVNLTDPTGLFAQCPQGTRVGPDGKSCVPVQTAPPFPGPGGPIGPNTPPLEAPPDDLPAPPGMLPGIRVAQRGLKKIASGDWGSNAGCRKVFDQLAKLAGGGWTADTIIGAVKISAADAINYVYDGPSSNVVLDPVKFPDVATAKVHTVGQWFTYAGRGRQALSQYDGNAIFVLADHAMFAGDAEPTDYGIAALLHEILHKKHVGGGFDHGQMTTALKKAGVLSRSLGRNDISQSFRICF